MSQLIKQLGFSTNEVQWSVNEIDFPCWCMIGRCRGVETCHCRVEQAECELHLM